MVLAPILGLAVWLRLSRWPTFTLAGGTSSATASHLLVWRHIRTLAHQGVTTVGKPAGKRAG
jgi:hypothetical protein